MSHHECPVYTSGKCCKTSAFFGCAAFIAAVAGSLGFGCGYLSAPKINCCPMSPVCQPQKVVIEVVCPKNIPVVVSGSIQGEVTGNVNVKGCVGVEGCVKGDVGVKCECCPAPAAVPTKKPEVKTPPVMCH